MSWMLIQESDCSLAITWRAPDSLVASCPFLPSRVQDSRGSELGGE